MKITTTTRVTEIEVADYHAYGTNAVELVKALHEAGHDRVSIDFASPGATVSEISASADKPKKKHKPKISRRLALTLAAAAVLASTSLSIEASAEQLSFQYQDVETGEDLLQYVQELGGRATLELDPESGLIDSIEASFYATDYDSDEIAAVLESLEASGTPTAKKLVGDLAQTSILTGNGQEQVLCLSEWSIAWKRKMVEGTNTDDALYEGYLGSTKGWTATAKYMFLDSDTTQSDAVLSAIDTNSLDPLTWNFFPTVETGRAAFQGKAFVEGINLGSGSGKIVGLDVSLRGTGPLRRLVQAAPVANSATVTGLSAQVTV